MKMRSGFVSNSSSSSYVIALTRDFEVSQEKIQEFLDSCNDFYGEEELQTLEQADAQIKKIIETLCSHGEIWFCEGSPVEYLNEFIDTFEDELKIISIDSGPDEGKVVNILADRYREETMIKLKKVMEIL